MGSWLTRLSGAPVRADKNWLLAVRPMPNDISRHLLRRAKQGHNAIISEGIPFADCLYDQGVGPRPPSP